MIKKGMILLAAMPFLVCSAFAVSDCLSVHDRAERLACYDRVAGFVPQVIKSGEETSTSEQNAQNTPAIPEPLAPSPQEVAERTRKAKATAQTYPVTKLNKTNTGKVLVYLADGQVWRQSDTKTVRLKKDAPDEVTIQPGALGSFFIKWDGQRRFRAKRVR